jgi:hypothetical protein
MTLASVAIQVRLLSHKGDEYEKIVNSWSPGDEETNVHASCDQKCRDGTEHDSKERQGRPSGDWVDVIWFGP